MREVQASVTYPPHASMRGLGPRPFEFCRRELPKARVSTGLVQMASEIFDHHLRVDPVLEPLHAQTLVAELAVERSFEPFCHGLAGMDVRSVDVRLRDSV